MFSFVKNRYKLYAIGIALVLLSLLSPWILKLHQGIDMTGGIQTEYAVSGAMKPVDTVKALKESFIPAAKATLSPEFAPIITDTLVYQVSGTDHVVVEAGIDESAAKVDGHIDLPRVEAAKTAFGNAMKAQFAQLSGTQITEARYVNVGASFGDYIKRSGYITLALAIFAISLYIQYAFRGSIAGMASWPFAVVTGISLLHDVAATFGLYALTSHFFPEFKIDTFFITAMLTVLGYSMSDTIVVMDRIRSNLRDSKMSKLPLGQIIDASIWGTMRRSIFTSLTIVIVLLAMFFFGPQSIKGFTLALIFGTLVGTYSSVCLAAPMLIDIAKKK